MINDNPQRTPDSLPPRQNSMWPVAAIAVVFMLFAMGGSFYVSRHMNRTADIHQSSAGRPGDEKPNLIQEQQNDKSARSPSTTGQNTPSPVPPASR